MERYRGSYALVQFSPIPERLEFLNIGLALMVPDIGFYDVRFARGQSRVEKIFGKQSKSFVDAIKESFRYRFLSEGKSLFESGYFEDFASKRANNVRLSKLLPISVSQEVDRDFAALFEEIVGDDEPIRREPRIQRKLREAFKKNHVEELLDRPSEIELPEYGISVNVPYGYQNGCYNLIDGMRMPAKLGDGLREAGKRAIEGNLIWKSFEGGPHCKRLVVVGDFKEQSNEFYNAIRDQFRDSHVKLHRLDDMRPLINDIIDNSDFHGRKSPGLSSIF